jgi:hypothetical protein
MPCFDGRDSKEMYHSEYINDPEDKRKIQELEVQLCKARNTLLSVFLKLNRGEALNIDEERAIQEETQRHLIHRREDREARLSILVAKLTEYTKAQKNIEELGGEAGKGTKIFENIEKTAKHIAWIQSLTDEQILYDRNILDRVPKDFTPTVEKNPYTKIDIEKIYRRLKKIGKFDKSTDFSSVVNSVLLETNLGAQRADVEEVVTKFRK